MLVEGLCDIVCDIVLSPLSVVLERLSDGMRCVSLCMMSLIEELDMSTSLNSKYFDLDCDLSDTTYFLSSACLGFAIVIFGSFTSRFSEECFCAF